MASIRPPNGRWCPMRERTEANLRRMALGGNLAATVVTLYISYVIGAGGNLPVVGEVGPSILWAVVFFLFGSIVVNFAFKVVFFAVATPIFLAEERAGHRV